MRKWLSITLLAIAVMALISFSFIPQQRAEREQENSTDVLLTIYTDMPAGILQSFAESYKQENPVQVTIISLPEDEIVRRLTLETNDFPDIVWGSEMLLRRLHQLHLLQAYTSEYTDLVAPQFKNEDGFWTGTWYLPIVFAIRDGYYREIEGELYTWDDLVDLVDADIVMTDFLAADLSAELLYSLVTLRGEEEALNYLRQLHRHVRQYAKYLSTPVRLLSTQRCDIAIADGGTVREFIDNGYPIRMVYPQDGTAYYLYACGVTADSAEPEEASRFIDWVLGGSAFSDIRKQRYYLYYTSIPDRQVADAHGFEPILWELRKDYTRTGQKELIDKWLNEVRFPEDR